MLDYPIWTMRLSHSAIEISRTSQQSPDPEHLFTMEQEVLLWSELEFWSL
jgi:hypothetical protein